MSTRTGILVLVLLSVTGWSHGRCPPAENIAPICTCKDFTVDSFMTCSKVLSVDELRNPIQSIAATGSKIFSIEINNSSLMYIPHDLFKGTFFEKIRLVNTEIMSLSDTDLAFEGLEDTLFELRATDAFYTASWDWQQLRNLHKMDLIDINWIVMGSVSEPFPELKKLTSLGIIRAGITHIVEGAFANLPSLTILSMKHNSIGELKRNMLPDPANSLAILDFSDNDLLNLPKDFFRDMPSLANLHLSNNKFYTYQEDVFKWPMENLQVLAMDGNKIECDCRIRWLVGQRVPQNFISTCHRPEILSGKKIKLLNHKDLWC